MATKLVNFRASGDFLAWLESQQQEGESLHLTAQRLLKELAGNSQPTTAYTPSTQESTQEIEQRLAEKLEALVEEKLKGFDARLKKQKA